MRRGAPLLGLNGRNSVERTILSAPSPLLLAATTVAVVGDGYALPPISSGRALSPADLIRNAAKFLRESF